MSSHFNAQVSTYSSSIALQQLATMMDGERMYMSSNAFLYASSRQQEEAEQLKLSEHAPKHGREHELC